jgi:hypothetical protein
MDPVYLVLVLVVAVVKQPAVGVTVDGGGDVDT